MKLINLIAPLFISLALLGQESVSLRLAGWNMEGNGNDISPALLESQLADKVGVDLWGLSEVRPGLFERYLRGAAEGEGTEFGIVRGSSGGNIRLAIIYDKSVLEMVASSELDERVFDRYRDPLVAEFRGRRTGQRFLFMVNHLARGNADARRAQAVYLNQWARRQSLPVVAVGDYNFDFHLERGDFGQRDRGFDEMVKDGAFEWVRPRVLVKTQASGRYRTVLDFVFVANADLMREQGWVGESRILKRAGDAVATEVGFSDSRRETDHRPVDAVLTLESTEEDESDPLDEELAQIRADIDAMQELLEELRRRLDALQRRR